MSQANQPDLPDNNTRAPRQKKQKSVPELIFNFLSGYLLALITLVILGLLVWLSTLEQTEIGLQATAEKYYYPTPGYVIPEINGKTIPIILPGAYWTCAILFVNMLLGGIIRIRKGFKQIGPVISHFGILLLLFTGFVDHHKSIHGHMDTRQFGTYDYAWKRGKTSLEVFRYDKDQNKTAPYVIKHEMLEDLDHDSGNPKYRLFKFKDLPFNVEVRNFYENADIFIDNGAPRKSSDGLVVDGLFLRDAKVNPSEDLYMYACYVTIRPKDGSKARTLILSRTFNHPLTFSVGGELFGIEMPNEIWKMPYEIKLINSRGEFYPGTERPSHYSSDIVWKDSKGVEKKSLIEMNKPLRHKGYTLYQASWTPPTNGIQYSGFVIVTNPSDEWPVYCLAISAFGLCFHFFVMFAKYLRKEQRKSQKNLATIQAP